MHRSSATRKGCVRKQGGDRAPCRAALWIWYSYAQTNGTIGTTHCEDIAVRIWEHRNASFRAFHASSCLMITVSELCALHTVFREVLWSSGRDSRLASSQPKPPISTEHAAHKLLERKWRINHHFHCCSCCLHVPKATVISPACRKLFFSPGSRFEWQQQ